MTRARLTARIAVFAALIYVLSWVTSYIPNLNLVFFLVFSSGFLWGVRAGLMVGGTGMALWTFFNPYGPAPFPVMAAQIAGASLSGVAGHLFHSLNLHIGPRITQIIWLVLASVVCTAAFFLPVTLVDAWLFQPFWPRFIAGISWSLISFVSNAIIFSLLFHVTLRLYRSEQSRLSGV
ncbi:MAG: ECF transporter S component [bacterium]|nr:ECF transporter S component [bacterium]